MKLQITRETLADGTVRARQQHYATAHPQMRWRSDEEMNTLFEAILARHDPADDLWVFGYGSLIWNPAIEYAEKRPMLLHGWHRSFCLRMFMGRGTPDKPGLMLGLAPGGACKGAGFRIAAANVREELRLLWQREMYGGAYNARWVTVKAGETRGRAIAFVINPTHPRYAPGLSLTETAQMIATGAGDLGTCREYLENTIAGLAAMGLHDRGLSRLHAALPAS